jgi:hypothetical protein
MMNAIHAHRRLALSLVLAIALGFALSSCATTPNVPKSQPMPAGKTFTGVWYSPQFEHMNLRQTGDRVAGVYTYQNGGRIEGKVDGNLLIFTWVEPGNKERARRSMKGSGYLQLLVGKGEYGKTKLAGEWGYGDDLTGGGPWTATWVRELVPEDPLTLEDLRESRD